MAAINARPIPRLSWSDIQRFWDKVEIPNNHKSCFNWKAGKFTGGYGCFKVGNRHLVASRVSCTMFHGHIPIGMEACHTCDNTSCCNPLHLYIGSVFQNSQDMVSRGRDNPCRGETNGWAKLNPESVLKIRALCAEKSRTQKDIGLQFGVSQAAVGLIHRKERWAHI